MNILLIALFVLVIAALLRYGADSRDGQDWRRDGARATGAYRRRHSLRTDLRRVRDLHRGQTELYERYLLTLRPWESRALRWNHDRLVGDRLPR